MDGGFPSPGPSRRWSFPRLALGRSKPVAANLDALFALPSAAITLQHAGFKLTGGLGLLPGGGGGVRADAGRHRRAARRRRGPRRGADHGQLRLHLAGHPAGPVHLSALVTDLHAVNTTLAEAGVRPGAAARWSGSPTRPPGWGWSTSTSRARSTCSPRRRASGATTCWRSRSGTCWADLPSSRSSAGGCWGSAGPARDAPAVRARVSPRRRLVARSAAAGVVAVEAELLGARGPGAPALPVEDLLAVDLLGAGRLVGPVGPVVAAVGVPGVAGELQPAVVAVAGVDVPACWTRTRQPVPGGVAWRPRPVRPSERGRAAGWRAGGAAAAAAAVLGGAGCGVLEKFAFDRPSGACGSA